MEDKAAEQYGHTKPIFLPGCGRKDNMGAGCTRERQRQIELDLVHAADHSQFNKVKRLLQVKRDRPTVKQILDVARLL